MTNNGDRRVAAGNITSLDPSFGVFPSLLIGPFRDADPLQTNRYPGHIHHREHVLEATILLADQITESTSLITIRQHTGGAAVNA